MGRDTDQYDFFVSYARIDNRDGWVSRFVEELLAEHSKFSGGRPLTYFFDKRDIRSFDDWQHRIYSALAATRLFLALISPSYFASEWCRREWRTWIDLEIAKHILSGGSAPIYFVEVPGFVGKVPGLQEQGTLDEHEVARRVAELCDLPPAEPEILSDAARIIQQMRDRRQIVSQFVQPFRNQGIDALHQQDLRCVLKNLAEDLDERAERVRRAGESESTVPPYNRRFSGRLRELLQLRENLKDDQAGVICGVHGLGGIGKTELAYTYAHAFASSYPGGRFNIPCEGNRELQEAILSTPDFTALFHHRISDEERMEPAIYFAAIMRCLRERLERLGHILLVLDNVTDMAVISSRQTDPLTSLGPRLHLLATTRNPPPANANWLTLDELPAEDALALLEKHRSFANQEEREAARQIVRQLGGFTLAVELVAAGLAVHQSATYTGVAAGLGLEDLQLLSEDRRVELRRHNQNRRLEVVLNPTLDRLEPAQHRTLQYAALLPPDRIPLAWLRELVTAEFSELSKPGRWGDPWEELCEQLVRLALFTRVEEETTSRRLVRVHRLVQDLVRREMSPSELSSRQEAVDALIRRRDTALEEDADLQTASWEVAPLADLARLWDAQGRDGAAWLLRQAGLRYYHLADWSAAEPLMRRSLAVSQENYENDTPDVARAMNSLGQLLQATNRPTEAEPLYRRALTIDEQCFGSGHPEVATDLNHLAELLKTANRLVEAEPLYRRALGIDEQVFENDHPAVARDLSNLAQLLKATNRLAEAEPLMRRALAIDEHVFGEDHPNVAIRLNNLGQLLKITNRLAEAEPLMRRALAIDEESFGNEHPRVAIRLNNLARSLKATNRFAEAEPLYRRALAIDEQSYGEIHPKVAIRLNNLARLFMATSRPAEAEPLLHRALAIDEQSLGSEHPKVAIRLNNLARLLKATGRPSAAEPLLRRTLEIRLRFTADTGHRHPKLETSFRDYAALLRKMGRSHASIQRELKELRAKSGLPPV